MSGMHKATLCIHKTGLCIRISSRSRTACTHFCCRPGLHLPTRPNSISFRWFSAMVASRFFSKADISSGSCTSVDEDAPRGWSRRRKLVTTSFATQIASQMAVSPIVSALASLKCLLLRQDGWGE